MATGRHPARNGSTKVKGPGQNCAATASARASNTAKSLRRRQIGHMHDQRIEPWPPLGIKYPRHRQIRPRIAAKAVDRLGWKGDKPLPAAEFLQRGQGLAAWDQGFRFCSYL